MSCSAGGGWVGRVPRQYRREPNPASSTRASNKTWRTGASADCKRGHRWMTFAGLCMPALQVLSSARRLSRLESSEAPREACRWMTRGWERPERVLDSRSASAITCSSEGVASGWSAEDCGNNPVDDAAVGDAAGSGGVKVRGRPRGREAAVGDRGAGAMSAGGGSEGQMERTASNTAGSNAGTGKAAGKCNKGVDTTLPLKEMQSAARPRGRGRTQSKCLGVAGETVPEESGSNPGGNGSEVHKAAAGMASEGTM